jgi:hypothetical protein
MGKSVCCNAETQIGYYNADQRPDIHGVQPKDSKAAIGVLGTYCKKCGKLCDYISGDNEFYTNGIIKTVKKE